ncbi:MAG: molybdopterin-binding protein [Desulfomonile tiedjei]|uniref:Molybdopterin molybdenumtransferase n=1 Tax=Desulfomonile tiedjei TaxID=2358 RepID=A0A9D6V1T2_9BACT|nr:molybdopterin-binding protein [Desulfomonile tiedjei]
MCETVKTPQGRLIEVSDAVGTVLAHDITEVRPGECKGACFKKGHKVTDNDVPHLARLGKRHLYILNIDPDMMHEDEAAVVLANALAGLGIIFNPEPSEGKINLIAAYDGLLKVEVQTLTDFNLVEGLMCASRHTNTLVRKGEVVAGTRAIPLVISREAVAKGASIAEAAGGVFAVKHLAHPKTGMIVTGQEVYDGLIQDKFVPAIRPKLESYECPILKIVFAPDDADFIAQAIHSLISEGAELIVATGGLSVDPDDVTRTGVMKAGAQELIYGSAVLPGAMVLISQVGSVPVIGIPACGMYHHNTVFDLILPRVLAGEKLTRSDLASLGHGGLCLNCEVCRFPTCPFGKSI